MRDRSIPGRAGSSIPIAAATALGLAATLLLPPLAAAQSSRPPALRPTAAAPTDDDKPPETEIRVELITGTDTGAGIHGQRWSELFQDLDVEFRIRRGIAGDKPEIREKKIGKSYREILLVGRLERDGKATFPGKSFTPSDADDIAEWLRELKTYGAQGTPDAQPVWGLSKPQFEALHKVLSQPVPKETRELSLPDAVAAIAPPGGAPQAVGTPAAGSRRDKPAQTNEGGTYAVRWTPAATRVRDALPPAEPLGVEVRGIARGTALAIALRRAGLGFRPNRTPTGEIEIQIEPLTEKAELWPIGWPSPKPGSEIAPKYYALTKVGFEEEPLVEILEALPDLIELPLLIDRHGCEQEKIDIDRLKVSFPTRQGSWARVLQSLTFQARCRRELWVDEAGRPFLWITPLKSPDREGRL